MRGNSANQSPESSLQGDSANLKSSLRESRSDSWQFAELTKETSASPCFVSEAKQPSTPNRHSEPLGEESKNNTTIFALKDAFRQDIEILFGYVSMGFCCGVLLKTSGFSAIYALIMSVFVYSGVMQFLAISFFSAGASITALLNIFLITLILNSRQSFYTLIMLEKFRAMDWKRFLNIFWLTDETFAILKTKKPKSNDNLFVFFVSLLNYIYWGFGCVLGAVVGGFITFDTRGLEFIMTAIFVVILIDNLKAIRSKKGYAPAVIGVATALFWLVLIGEQYFLLVALASSVGILSFCYYKKWDFVGESSLDSGADSSIDSRESKQESTQTRA